MDRTMKRFETNDGPLMLEFDFIPQEPTTYQLEQFVPHTCETCEWKKMKRTECTQSMDPMDTTPCAGWCIGPDAYWEARVAYYKDLHMKYYG